MFAAVTVAVALTGISTAVNAATSIVVLQPLKDTTIWREGELSNGAGEFLYAGQSLRSDQLRRTLLAFDVASSVPAGSVVQSIELVLQANRVSESTAVAFSLHRLVADWGEGTSNAGSPGGAGATATTGDATWTYRFYPDALSGKWSSPGGDYESTASATASVGDAGSYTWGSTPNLVSDVQTWLDQPGNNFGWILIGGEGTSASAKRFASSAATIEANRPALMIVYAPVPEPSTYALIGLGLGMVGFALKRPARKGRLG